MSSAPIHALLVEDDARLARFTREYLGDYGVVVQVASDGHQGLAAARATSFDVIVLDLMLPGLDGLSVCRRVREKSDVPLLMITARAGEADRVLGLEVGADDYLVKPYSPRELLARIRALVRRHRGELAPPDKELRVGPLAIDRAARRARLRGVALELTTGEFDILLALAQHAGRPLTRDQLLDQMAGRGEDAFDRAVDVHVSRLRQKLGDDARRSELLKTVRGIGYMLVASADEGLE